MPGAELVDPVAYSGWWPWVALGLVVAVVAFYVWVLRSTRAPADAPPPAAAAPPAPATARTGQRDPYAALRETTLARLDEVWRRYRAGDVDERGAHLEIRYAVREFATGRTGVDASSMTATAARADHRMRPLAALLESSAVPTFGATSRTRVSRSLDQARKRVQKW